jgi:hypothetical protein
MSEEIYQFFLSPEPAIEFHDWLMRLSDKKGDNIRISELVPKKFLIFFRRFLEKFSLARQNHPTCVLKETGDQKLLADHYCSLGDCKDGSEIIYQLNPPVIKKVTLDECKFEMGNSIATWLAFGLCEEEAKLILDPSVVGVKGDGYFSTEGLPEFEIGDIEAWSDDDIVSVTEKCEEQSFEENNFFYAIPQVIQNKIVKNPSFVPNVSNSLSYLDTVGHIAGWPLKCIFGNQNWDRTLLFGNMFEAGELAVSPNLTITIYDDKDDDKSENRIVLDEAAKFSIGNPLCIARLLID